jgi:hypothetical protein
MLIAHWLCFIAQKAVAPSWSAGLPMLIAHWLCFIAANYSRCHEKKPMTKGFSHTDCFKFADYGYMTTFLPISCPLTLYNRGRPFDRSIFSTAV